MRLPAKLIHTRDCFVQLPSSAIRSLTQSHRTNGSIILSISWDVPYPKPHRKSAYVSWNGGLSGDDSIEIPRTLAVTLGLDKLVDSLSRIPVSVEAIDYVANAAKVDVEPLTSVDWEIVELNAEHLEGELLQQVCVVYPNQLIPIWVHGSTLITLRVLSTATAAGDGGQSANNATATAPQRLTSQAEVRVSPKPRPQRAPGGGANAPPPPLRRSGPLRVQPWPMHVSGYQYHNFALCHPATLRSMHGKGTGADFFIPMSFLSSDWSRGVSSAEGECGCVLATIWLDESAAISAAQGLAAASWGGNSAGVGGDVTSGNNGSSQLSSNGRSPVSLVLLLSHPAIAPQHIAIDKSVALNTGCGPLSIARIRLVHQIQKPPPLQSPRMILQHLPPLASRYQTSQTGGALGASKNTLDRHSSTEPADTFILRQWSMNTPLPLLIMDGDIITVTVQEQNCSDNEGETEDKDTCADTNINSDMSRANIVTSSGDSINYRLKLTEVDASGNDVTSNGSPQSDICPRPYIILEEKKEKDKTLEAAVLDDRNDCMTVQWPSTARDCFALEAAFDSGVSCESLGGVEIPLRAVLDHITPVVAWTAVSSLRRLSPYLPASGCTLVHGGPGTGKATLISAAVRALRRSPASFAKTFRLNCRNAVRRPMVRVLESLSAVFSAARVHAPSIIVLDNLDALCPPEDDEISAANGQIARIAEKLGRLIEHRGFGVAVLASAASSGPTGISPRLWCSGIFEKGVELLPPKAEQRAAILRLRCLDASAHISDTVHTSLDGIVSDTLHDKGDVDWEEAGARTDGYRPSDLVRVARRAKHNAALRALKASDENKGLSGRFLTIKQEDVDKGISGVTPEALTAAKLSKPGTVEWSDVGGLKDVKSSLLDILALPVKYRRLVERMPYRLPTGVLLYGPPGCGKTLVAGAVAKECGLNFISVKGPEVLDKYIGASEQAVRALFARASAAAPCALFFDEFEAVAPRRGSDNTGVTDRVVNQLLTFLDGVEGLRGVYVLAATSRPDMIDPALLRPGRLDKQLYCGFPSSSDRAEIAVALSRSLSFGDGAQDALVKCATSQQAQTFTGADLQGVINAAQLNAIHDYLAAATAKLKSETTIDTGPSLNDNEAPDKRVTVEVHHVHKAMTSAKPSMSIAARQEYEISYRKFAGGRKADFTSMSSTDDGGKLRTALK